MITLEIINEPLNPSNVQIQKLIMNSQPSFNLIVLGKELITDEEIIEENRKNLESGEIMFHIKDGEKYIGTTTYLPKNPHDNHPWIGLLLIQKAHERKGSGSTALKLLEKRLIEQKEDKVRLCVQFGNDSGTAFWQKNGFVKIGSNTDKHNNYIGIYEKRMQPSIQLVSPSIDYQEQYLAFYEDWKMSEEEIVPWIVEKDPYDFKEMIEFLYSEDTEVKVKNADWVPHSTLWLVNEEGKIIGVANIRHRLNQNLLNSGEHIGYGIRPSYRRKGYATILLSLTLQHVKKLGLEKVLVVCDKGNIGSEKTILKNGGQFESEYVEENGNVIRRFWIEANCEVGNKD